jgi:hypothetical protein
VIFYSLRNKIWRYQTARRMEAWRDRAVQLRIQNPEGYEEILGRATEEGQPLAEKDPDGFVAFVLADSRNPRSRNRVDP